MGEARGHDGHQPMERRWITTVAILIGVYTLSCWLIPPELFNDTAAGYQTWLSMRAGGPFNAILTPSSANLAADTAVFQSWWAPGQYLVPGIFNRLGLPLGRATLLVVALASVGRIVGYWRLWRLWGVPAFLATECVLLAVLVRPFSGYFGNAYVGDVLQAAAIPWLTLLVWRWRELCWWQCAALVPILGLAVGVKLSMLVALAAILGSVVTGRFNTRPQPTVSEIGMLSLKAAVIFAVVKLAWDFYLRQGASIASGLDALYFHAVALTQPFAGPLFSGLGMQSLLNRFFLFPGAPVLTPAQMWPWYVVGMGATGAVLMASWQRFHPREYVLRAATWVVTYGLIFTAFYVGGASVSYEERHYFPAGMVVLPCTVFVLRHVGGRAWRICGTGILAGLCLYGLASFATNAAHRRRDGAVGIHQFTHTTLSRGALAELRRLDDEPAGSSTVFYVTMPEIGLEVRHGRVITLPADWWSEDLVRQFRFAGRGPRVVLILPGKFAGNGKVELVEAEFPGYRDWHVREVDGFLFVTAG